MSRFGKEKAGVKRFLVLVLVCLMFGVVVFGCGRFSVGDPVGVPPLPPSDHIIGVFDKVLSADLTENTYRLKDTPTSGVTEPVGLTYAGKYRMFFLYNGVIRMGTLRAASPYIETGLDGVADSGLGAGDVQINQVGTGSLTDADIVVAPGIDSNLKTNVPRDSDDEIVYAICPGVNSTLDTACSVNDVVSSDGLFCLPGGDNVLDSVPANSVSLNFDDKRCEVILAGDDGIAQSGLGEGDIQGVAVFSSYSSRTGINVGYGENNRMVVSSGKSPMKTACVFDDNTSYDVKGKIVRNSLTDGIYSGIDGIAQSGLGGDDIQVVKAGRNVAGGGIIVRSGPDQLLQTSPIGHYDVQVVPAGTSAGGADALVVSPGRGGKLRTCPEGDDYVMEQLIMSGGDAIADTVAQGDDIQLAPYGISAGVMVGVIASGPNRVIDTLVPGGDDQFSIPSDYGIAAGANGVADTKVDLGDDKEVVLDGGDLLAGTGLGGDDIQIFSAGLYASQTPTPIVGAGDDGILQTRIIGDDVEMVYNQSWPFTAGVAHTAAIGDDVQVVPVGQPTAQDLGGGNIVVFPVLLPGLNGVIDSPTSVSDMLVIADYGSDFEIFRNLAISYYGDSGIGDYTNPFSASALESGLGGRGALDYIAGCAAVLDNGGTPGVDDPFADSPSTIPSYSQCMDRNTTCPDDCQTVASGSAVAANGVIIDGGANGNVDTKIAVGVVDDLEAIVDGGDGVAQSGLGDKNEQIIKAGNGQPDTMEIIAARDATTGMIRTLTTLPAGDDVVVDPGSDKLSGDGDVIAADNIDTIVNPDGDKRVENFAAVDDGEYFSWESTNVDTSSLVPAAPVNVPYDLGILKSQITYNIFKDEKDSDRLLMYLSNGMNIYLSTSMNGLAWSTPELVLEAGDNPSETDPVVLAGVNGICNTAAQNDDVQAIPVGQGLPNTVGIFIGPDGIFQSVIHGDDYRDGNFIRAGADGINDSDVAGDDWLVLPKGQGAPDTACVLAGPNGARDTSDGMIALSDDRPPFVDLNWDSGTNYLPDSNEPSITQGGTSGFDAFAITSPFVFKKDGKFYMFYSGWGALAEPEAQRPDLAAEAKFGPCLRPGMDWSMNPGSLSDSVNYDNTPGVVVAPRIGLAVSNDGVNWKKQKNPVVGIGSVCSSLTDLSIVNAIIDVSSMGLDLRMSGSPDFDYLGALAPRVRSDKASDGNPVYTMLYTGMTFDRPYDPSNPLGGLFAVMALPNGREQYAGAKTALGMARSFGLTDGWTKLKTNSPVFSGGLFFTPIWEQSPTVLEDGNGYFAYFGEMNAGNTTSSGDEETYIAVATRQGTIYSICMAVRNTAGTVPAQAAFGLFLILLPGIILVIRRAVIKTK